jgi:hypothetical protein
MKKNYNAHNGAPRRVALPLLCACALSSFASLYAAKTTPGLRISLSTGEAQLSAITAIDSLCFNAAEDTLFVVRQGVIHAIPTSQLEEISYTASMPTTVNVTYDGKKATVENPFAYDGVEVTIDGADVIVNSDASDEVEYKLSGESSDGMFKIYSNKKYQITLNGVQLTNADGPAINSQSSKKGTIKVQGSTFNTLCDAKKYTKSSEDQKGTIFSEGQLIFKGAGTLEVTGLNKHAICSDDFLEIDNATIRVLAAASDAMHANDSVLIYGGKVSLTASGDGIDCSGPVIIASAATDSLTITLAEDETDGIKSDSLISIVSGNVIVNTSGAASKSVKSKGDIQISGGNLVVVNTAAGGTYAPEDDSKNTTSVASYKVYVSAPTSSQSNPWGGAGGPGGNGSNAWSALHLYKSDGTRVATLSATATIIGTNNTSTTFYYYDFGSATEGEYYFASDDYVSQGGGGWGGWGGQTAYSIRTTEFSAPSDGSSHYYSISSSYSTSGTVRTYTMSDVTSTYASGTVSSSSAALENYFGACLKADGDITVSGGDLKLSHSGAMSKGIRCDGTFTLNGGDVNIESSGAAQIVNNDPSYSTAIKVGAYRGDGGSVTVNASGFAGRAISVDGDMEVNDGVYALTCTGDGSTYTTASKETDGYAACGIKTDGNLTLNGGNFTIRMSGKGGKGIHADGKATFGVLGQGGPTLNVSTSGSVIASSGWGMSDNFIGTAKAIKIEGDVVVNDGNIFAKTTTNGGEGLESKASITFNGGYTECDTYDDGINAASKITFNDGFVYSHATGNDGIDCNGRDGFEFNGGVVLASGTSSPEEGFDCDNNTFKINGGILIGTGGSTSSPTSASQPYVSKNSVTVTSGKYLSVQKSDGTVLFNYRCPVSVSSATVLLSAPDFTSGTSYKLVTGATAVSNATESAFDGVFTRGGTVTGGSSTTFTPATR